MSSHSGGSFIFFRLGLATSRLKMGRIFFILQCDSRRLLFPSNELVEIKSPGTISPGHNQGRGPRV